MAKDRENMGGPTNSPKDEPYESEQQKLEGNAVQAQSKPEGDDERRNREDADKSNRNGSKSNAS